MRVHWTATIKIWVLTSLVLFYLVLQYHGPTSAGNFLQENETDTPKKLWLRGLVADERLAEEVQSALGDRSTKELAFKIMKQHCLSTLEEGNQNVIYIVTPTYRRPEQQAELTRLAQTLMHVPNIYWLLIEDAKEKSELISKLLKKWEIRTIHLNGKKDVIICLPKLA